MATRYARIMLAQGRESHVRLQGRLWTASGIRGCRELSECHPSGPGCVSYSTGRWTGMRRHGFHAIAEAGAYRRLAARERDDFRRRVLLRRAYEALERARGYEAPVLDVEAEAMREAA